MDQFSNQKVHFLGNILYIIPSRKEQGRILQYCYKMKLSLTHNYSICCWKMTRGMDGREMLPVLISEMVILNVGRLAAYSDDKVHAVFYDGITVTMNWDFSFHNGKTQNHYPILPSACTKNRDAATGWCKLTSPDGAQQLIEIDCPGVYERYIRTVVAWGRSLNNEREVLTHIPSPVTEENWYTS
uniref:C5orf34-like C-terminal domain-containing protein n=1 Tax=Sphenodon punctatus TaxID=8508 RepID=A0A8D0GHJ6_SPHPU